MDLMESQINRQSVLLLMIVIPEIQSIMGSLPLNRNRPEPRTSLTVDGIGNALKNKTRNSQRFQSPLLI